MGQLSKVTKGLLCVLVTGALLVGCGAGSESIAPSSTVVQTAQAPTITPTCNPPWPTPPSVACPWLPTPTIRPTSLFPTLTPWKPPTPLAQTPTALPLRAPAQNPAGRLIWRTTVPYGDELASIFYACTIAPDGQKSASSYRLAFQNPSDFLAPAGFDISMHLEKFVPSPDSSKLIGIQASEGGNIVFVFDSLTGTPILPKGHPVESPGLFYNWHPNGEHFLMRAEYYEPGLWLVDSLTGKHHLIAQPTTRDVSGATISPDGQQLVYATNTLDIHQIWMANADGSEPHLLLESKAIVYVFSWSPDGRYILYTGEPTAVVSRGTPAPVLGGPLWIMDRKGENRKPLNMPFIFGYGFEPAWSPTSRHIASVGSTDEVAPCWQKDSTFRADKLCRYKGTGVYVLDVETGQANLLVHNAIDPAWSPDGSLLAVARMDEHGQVDIWIVNANGAGLQRVTNTPEADGYPIWVQQ